MNLQGEALKTRTAAFAKAAIEMCGRLRPTQSSRHIADQLIAAATSVNANYRAACRARSRAEFIAKIGLVCEEADESLGWLELLVNTSQLSREEGAPLLQEADELTAIFVASNNTARDRAPRRPKTKPAASKPPASK